LTKARCSALYGQTGAEEKVGTTRRSPHDENGGPAMVRNQVPAGFSGIALLFSAGLVSGQDIDATSFRCITKMTHVRQFYVDNLLGNLDGTLEVATSTTGGTYPAGSVIQLIPGEAMVKRDKGVNPATNDWEFFELDVSKDGTKIGKRGFAEVVNRFGVSCLGCHAQARPQWDLVCEMDHGCPTIPLTRAMSGALQRTDPRCDNPPISADDAEALKQLEQLLKASE
jgi:hypothetical protein